MQEIGRAGRDGRPAVCEMLACADDVVTLENFSYGDTPEPATVGAIVDELLGQDDEFDVGVYDLAQRHDVRDLVVKTLFTYLELDGVLRSTGSFYSAFKFQPRRSTAEIVAQFDAGRAERGRAQLLGGARRLAGRGGGRTSRLSSPAATARPRCPRCIAGGAVSR